MAGGAWRKCGRGCWAAGHLAPRHPSQRLLLGEFDDLPVAERVGACLDLLHLCLEMPSMRGELVARLEEEEAVHKTLADMRAHEKQRKATATATAQVTSLVGHVVEVVAAGRWRSRMETNACFVVTTRRPCTTIPRSCKCSCRRG